MALVQMACGDSAQANIDKAIKWVERASGDGAQIVCLQELFAGLYPCQSEDHSRFELAEAIPGPTSERMSQTAKRLGIVLTGSIFERRSQGLYHNTAVVS